MMATCETVRDRLPDVLAGSLAGAEAQAVLVHVAACPDCAAEAALVKALRQAPELAPAGLRERVQSAARVRSVPRWSNLQRPALLAAAVGSVLLGASLLMQGHGSPGATDVAGAPQASATHAAATPDTPAPVAVSGPARSSVPDGRVLMQALPGTPDAGLYSSTATLEDLSEEELNTLLKELQS